VVLGHLELVGHRSLIVFLAMIEMKENKTWAPRAWGSHEVLHGGVLGQEGGGKTVPKSLRSSHYLLA
jgi:hypothetical protein